MTDRAWPMQMLKALMPVAVFTVGCFFGTESFSVNALCNMVIVTAGVAIASYGEINLVWVGVFLQLLSVATESTRLTLVGFGTRSDGAAGGQSHGFLSGCCWCCRSRSCCKGGV